MTIPPPGLGGGTIKSAPASWGGALPHSPTSSDSASMTWNSTMGFGTGLNIGGSSGSGGKRDPVQAISVVKGQVGFMVRTLTEDNFDRASNEIRNLVSAHGPELYHDFLRRAANMANPIIQALIHYSKDEPSSYPNLPSSGVAMLNWRMIIQEAVRASRDVTLAPHFSLVMLSSSLSPPNPFPLPSLRLLRLSTSLLFSLTAFTLASPQVFPKSHASYPVFLAFLAQTFPQAMDILQSPQVPFWHMGAIPGREEPLEEDLTAEEAMALVLALYPKADIPEAEGLSTVSVNPTPPHTSPLTSHQRATLLGSLVVKFSTPSIILRTIPMMSPGGPPRSWSPTVSEG
ncbi:hypothetical protein B9479_001317 [Cryptococcus floricola]|uniref:Uncharacterized protein n=1 Tax=Cryptococcus floricola TaxID=2591691 RepID=A0A5D3B5X9_9TREE|nr:hypothetical protein B9479_001317 [Cryptococcus floricola]